MSWFKNLKIGAQLGIGFGIILIMMVVMAITGIVSMKKMGTRLENIANISGPAMKNAEDALMAVTTIGSGIKTIAMLDDRKAQEAEKQNIDSARSRYKEAMTKLEELDKSEKAKELIARAKEAISTAKSANNKVMELAQAGKKNEAINLIISESQPLTKKVEQTFAELFKYEEEFSASENNQARSVNSSGNMYLIIIGCIALIAGTATSLFFTRNIVKRLVSLTGTMKVVADGDLTCNVKVDGNDEIGDLGRSINQMLEALNGIVKSINETADQVAAASRQLSATSERIAGGTEEMAAQTVTIATAGEELAATASDIAENSSWAADGAKQANDLATSGSEVVQKTICGIQLIAQRVKESANAVEGLGERSDQIGEIVGTIEDIADQTNLLALNAAIEAARAGEQGRGFAVVADEVRALAERTTQATKEIGSMIKAIQSETKNAVSIMNKGVSEAEQGAVEAVKSDQALTDILSQISTVSIQVSQIATAAEQQTATSSEISNNIHQITGVVGETTQGTQETAQAASQLAYLADCLNILVGNFKLAA
jgi:methyl-accepting chemotaxis protein